MSVCTGEGGTLSLDTTHLIGTLATSSALFRSMPSIIYRWEYISSEGGRAGLLPGKRRKKVSFWEGGSAVCGRTLGKREGKCQMGQE